jgi:hypothetical protein
MAVHKPDFSYYQIGGFRPNVALQGCSTSFFSLINATTQTGGEFRGLQYDMRKLAEAIVDPESTVDLVLGTLSAFSLGATFIREIGIRPSGASAILIPTSEWIKNEAFRYPGTPHLVADFLSLSPLQFNSALQLYKKLTSFKPKGKRPGEDDSAANKPYLGNVGQSGRFRSAFEHNRYHIVLLYFLP